MNNLVICKDSFILFFFCFCLTGWSKTLSMIMPARMWCFVDLSRKSEFSHLRIRWVDSLTHIVDLVFINVHQEYWMIISFFILIIFWGDLWTIFISSFYIDNRLFSYTIHPNNSFLFLHSSHLLPIFPLLQIYSYLL